MNDQELLDSLLDFQRSYIDMLSQHPDVVYIDDSHIQVLHGLFEALFPDGPEKEYETDRFIHHYHTYCGTKIVALYEKEADAT